MAEYQLILTSPGGVQTDLTELVQTMTWSGSIKQTARQLNATLAIPRDGSVTAPALMEGSTFSLKVGGMPCFTGPLVSVTTDSTNVLVDVSSLDRGWYMVQNEGWYKFKAAAPESVAAAVAKQFSIPVGTLAAAGVKISRKYPGVALDKIVTTHYKLAGEQNGKRYLLRFDGTGRLNVVEKASAAALSIEGTMGVVNTWDISRLQNSVAIYTDDGKLVRRVDDSASVAANGRLEHVLTQRKGQDAGAAAKAWLEDNGLAQTLTVECPGDTRLLTGEAVQLRSGGAAGLFWVDSDTHTWKNSLYRTKVTLNFRNLMSSTMAGSDLK